MIAEQILDTVISIFMKACERIFDLLRRNENEF